MKALLIYKQQVIWCRGGCKMNHIKPRLGDRRKIGLLPKAPFKDGNGATIKECRRKITDRRLYVIYEEEISEVAVNTW